MDSVESNFASRADGVLRMPEAGKIIGIFHSAIKVVYTFDELNYTLLAFSCWPLANC